MDDEQKKIELQKQYDAYRAIVKKQRSLKADGERIIDELESQGVTIETDVERLEGLGDLVHAALKKVGVTEERFKKIMGLKDCNCNKRRKLLNRIFPFVGQRAT